VPPRLIHGSAVAILIGREIPRRHWVHSSAMRALVLTQGLCRSDSAIRTTHNVLSHRVECGFDRDLIRGGQASGHVNRANRPNTLAATDQVHRAENPCQQKPSTHGTSQANRPQRKMSACWREPDLSQTYLHCLSLTRCGHGQSLGCVFFVVDEVTTTSILANPASRRRWQLCEPAVATA